MKYYIKNVLLFYFFILANDSITLVVGSPTQTCDSAALHSERDQCHFVKTYCARDDSFVPFLRVHYCTLKELPALSYVIMLVLTFLTFYFLGRTTDVFLVPTLFKISKALQLSPNVAGVTFLALGNGAPTIFSSVGAVQISNYNQVFGHLLGSSLFLSSFGVGVISMVSPFHAHRRPFLRDAGCLCVSVALIFFFCYDLTLQLWETILALMLYVLYVCTVIIGRIFFQRHKAKREQQRLQALATYEEANQTYQKLLAMTSHLKDGHIITQMDISLLHGSDSDVEEKVNFALKVIEAINNNEVSLSNLIQPNEPEEEIRVKTEILKEILKSMDVNYLNLGGFFWDGDSQQNNRRNRNLNNGNTRSSSSSSSAPPSKQNQVEAIHSELTSGELVSMLQNDPESSSNSDSDAVFEYGPMLKTEKKRETFWRLKEYFDWDKCSSAKKFRIIFEFPVQIFQHLTIRWGKEDKYYRPFYVLQPFFITFFIFTRFNLWLTEVVIQGKYAGLALYWATPVSICFCILLFVTTENKRPPHYDPFFVFIGLVICIIWLSSLSQLLVVLLNALGKIFSISDAIMGLIVLTWGNCIGDIIAIIMVAKRGLPEMSLGACYSTPLTNLLLAFGIGFTLKIINQGPITLELVGSVDGRHQPDLTNNIYISFCFVMANLLLTLVFVPLRGFRFPACYGLWWVVYYVVFVVLSFLLFYKVLLPNAILWSM